MHRGGRGGDFQVQPVEEGGPEENIEQGLDSGVLEATGASIFGGNRDENSSYYISAAGFQQLEDWFSANAPSVARVRFQGGTVRGLVWSIVSTAWA